MNFIVIILFYIFGEDVIKTDIFLMLKYKLYSLILTEINFSHLTLLLFNWTLYVSILFDLGLPSNFIENLPLKIYHSHMKKIYKIN